MHLFKNKKLFVVVLIIIVLVLILIFSKKDTDSERNNNPKEIDYTPTVREPLNSSLDLTDIDNDLNVSLEFPADDFNL